MDADMTVELEELGKDLESARNEEKESEETKQFRSITFRKKLSLLGNMKKTERKNVEPLSFQGGAEVWNRQVQDTARSEEGQHQEKD